MEDQELRALVEMTETDGWRILIREANDQLDNLQREALGVHTIEALKFIQGRANEMSYLVAFAELLEVSEDDEEDEDDDPVPV